VILLGLVVLLSFRYNYQNHFDYRYLSKNHIIYVITAVSSSM